MLYAKFKVDTYTVEAYTQHGNNAPFDKAARNYSDGYGTSTATWT